MLAKHALQRYSATVQNPTGGKVKTEHYIYIYKYKSIFGVILTTKSNCSTVADKKNFNVVEGSWAASRGKREALPVGAGGLRGRSGRKARREANTTIFFLEMYKLWGGKREKCGKCGKKVEFCCVLLQKEVSLHKHNV